MKKFNFSPFPELKTQRIHLRSVLREDAAAIFELRSHPEVKTYLARVGPDSLEEATKKIETLQNNAVAGKAVFWVICQHSDPGILGTICLWNLEPENLRAEVGYELHPNHRRKGYMREAMEAVLQYGLETMGLHTICAYTDSENTPSIRLLEQTGFVKEAHFREATYYGNRFHDTVVYTKFSF